MELKRINWIEYESILNDDIYHKAYINDICFLMVIPYKESYTIHTSFPIFEYMGNNARKYGTFTTLDECKIFCKTIIKKQLLNFFK